MTAIFYWSLKSSDHGVRRTQDASLQNDRSESTESQPVANVEISFLKSAKIYQYSLLYVFARTFGTTAMIFIPMWLEERLYQASHSGRDSSSDAGREHLSIIPMVSFLASFVSSVIMDRCHFVSMNWFYSIGSVLCVVGCILIETRRKSLDLANAVLYSVACLFGAGSSVTMISSMCMITSMIGKRADQGGFVYSVVTCADKLITGIAIAIIEHL